MGGKKLVDTRVAEILDTYVLVSKFHMSLKDIRGMDDIYKEDLVYLLKCDLFSSMYSDRFNTSHGVRTLAMKGR